jgi:NAD(P)-dependent dehydrogenase (short-subunit alcohol dehydrogenase family)
MAPGPTLQKLNSLVHKEPWASLGYCICWTFVLCVVAPLSAALVLIPYTIYRLLAWTRDWIGAKDYDPKNSNNNNVQLAIVVTGCDSGFGRDIALWASTAGFVVFAGCLNGESVDYFHGKNLETSTSRIIPMIMDVTKDDDVAKAAARVSSWLEEEEQEEQDRGDTTTTTSTTDSGGGGAAPRKKKRVLHALVNNAGIAIIGLFDWSDISDVQKVMDVNYFGILRCCKAFLPILKKQAIHAGAGAGGHKGGRIINLTSVAGLAPGGPFGWNYAASKHAAQTFTEGLRKELGVFGIGVTSINPGFSKTPMIESDEKQKDARWEKLSPKIREEYGKGMFSSTDLIYDVRPGRSSLVKTFGLNTTFSFFLCVVRQQNSMAAVHIHIYTHCIMYTHTPNM